MTHPLPLKVFNRLRMGRDVAARASASLPQHQAWVYVFPLLDAERDHYDRRYKELQALNSDGNTIKSYLVRYLEVSNATLDSDESGGLYDPDVPTIDQRYTISDEQELARLLSTWITDFAGFHVPSDVGYHFHEGPDLLPDDPTLDPIEQMLLQSYDVVREVFWRCVEEEKYFHVVSASPQETQDLQMLPPGAFDLFSRVSEVDIAAIGRVVRRNGLRDYERLPGYLLIYPDLDGSDIIMKPGEEGVYELAIAVELDISFARKYRSVYHWLLYEAMEAEFQAEWIRRQRGRN